MKKKQKIAYILALLLGFISVFGGVSLPTIKSVHAEEGATPIGTYHHNSSSLYAVYYTVTDEDGTTIDEVLDHLGYFGTEDNRDTITTDENLTYSLNGSINMRGNDDGIIKIEATFSCFEVCPQKNITVIYTSTNTVTASTENVHFTLSSEDLGSISPNTISLPVKHEKGTMKTVTEGVTYSAILGGDGYRNIMYNFTPSSSGKYTFNGTGGKNIAINVYGWGDDDHDFDNLDWDDRDFGHNTKNKIKTFDFPSVRFQTTAFQAVEL